MQKTSVKERLREFRRLKNEPLVLAAILAIIAFTAYFVIYPVFKMVTVANVSEYAAVWSMPRWMRALGNSLFMMVASGLSCTLIAFIFAYTMTRLDVPLKKLFRFVRASGIENAYIICVFNVFKPRLHVFFFIFANSINSYFSVRHTTSASLCKLITSALSSDTC